MSPFSPEGDDLYVSCRFDYPREGRDGETLFTLRAERQGDPEQLTSTARTILAILQHETSLRGFIKDSVDEDAWVGSRLLGNLRRLDDLQRPEVEKALDDLWRWFDQRQKDDLPPEIKSAATWLLSAKKMVAVVQRELAPTPEKKSE